MSSREKLAYRGVIYLICALVFYFNRDLAQFLLIIGLSGLGFFHIFAAIAR